MRPARGWPIWALSALFLAGCLYWILQIPAYRRDLARLIPPQATVILRPHDLAGEWPQWIANPAVAGWLAGAGTSTNQLQKWGADVALAGLLRRSAPGECALAYVPSLGPARQPAWLMVSWLGGRSQVMRWMLKTGRVGGATRIFKRNGHLIWRLASRDLPPGQTLTVSVAEGMLVACLSSDLGAIIDALDGYDGLRTAPPVSPSTWPDVPLAGVQAVYREFGAWTPTHELWRFDVSRCEPARLIVSARGPWPVDWPVGGPDAHKVPAWNPAQRAAVIRLTVDRELALFGAGHVLRDLPALAGELVRHDAAGPLQLSVVDGPFAGRSRGLKLPTVLLGLGVISEPIVRARLGIMTDLMNRQYRWGLVSHELGAGPFRPMAVESTSETTYARFALNEQLAWLVTNRTLVLASNTEGFTNLLGQASAASVSPGPVQALGPDAVADAWMDLRAGGKSLRLLLTAWSLNVDERDRERCALVRGRIQQAKAWVDALAPLENARVVVRRTGGEMVVGVQTGDQL